MNVMHLLNGLGYIDEDLVFDAMDSGESPQPEMSNGFVKSPAPSRPPRGGARVKGLIIGLAAVFLAAIVTLVSLYVAGVFSPDDPANVDPIIKQTPIYQGMYISSAEDSGSSADASSSTVSYKYKGDYFGKGDDLDTDEPFEDGSIEQEVENSLKITGAGQSIYYATVNEDIYITIKFSNPDYYDIVSFVLSDGTTETHYTSYMFVTGSDYENIIIKLNVGNTAGIIEYTISEIKYLDDSKVNSDVIIDGDTVVTCGVRTTSGEMVSATVKNEVIDLTSISFTVNITDAYSLIAYESGDMMAVLYDGESIVETVDLEVGENQVKFTDLAPDTLYQYAIVAYYDDLSGAGAMVNYLSTNAVYTSAVVLFNDISVDQEGITFSYVWYEGYENQTITSLTLSGGGQTKTLTASDTSVTDLLSDTEYTLTAYYVGNNGETASITLGFTTEAKAVPTVEISALSSEQESISYALAVTDTDSVGAITSVTLSLDGKTIETLTTATGTFTGLLSDNTYTLTVIYTYDLNDGQGEQTAQATQEITTKAKAVPMVEISTLTSEQESISYALTITDTDNVGAITSVTLSLDGKAIETLTTATGTFSNLLSDNTYTLTVVYTYDLNDGNNDQTTQATQEITTKAKAVPTVEISTLESEQESISYALTITDTDNVGAITSVTLSLDGKTIETLTTATGTFSNLLSDNTYTLTVVYTYNLNDGQGEQTAQATKEITTKAKAVPTVEIEVTATATDGLTFSVVYNDADNIGKITAIALYNGSMLVKSETNLLAGEYTYSELTSYTQYTLKVSYEYDLNDGAETRTAVQTCSDYTDPVLAFTSISVLNTSAVSTGDTIIVQAEMTNPDGVTFKYIVVNGITYSVSNVSTTTRLRADIENDGQFEGGNTALTITQIICTKGEKTYTVDVSSDNTTYVFINGELNLSSLTVVRSDGNNGYEETDYGFKSEQLYYQLSLSNSTGYSIDSVTLGGKTYTDSDYTISDDKQTIYISIDTSNASGMINVTLSSISYSNTNIGSKTKSFDYTVSYMHLSGDSEVEISTADDLLKMDGYQYYKLINDIDLSGKEWVNMENSMYGVFDGGGYTISNMGAVTNYSDTDLYMGLFKNVKGIITNLNIENVLYMVNLDSTTGDKYNVYAAGLGINAGDVIISKVTVDISVEITITGSANQIYVGGLLANINYANCVIEDANITAVVSINAVNNGNNGSFNVGGLYGAYGAQGSYTNSINNVTVDLKTYLNGAANNTNIGAIAGYISANRAVNISDAVLKSQAEINYTTYAFDLGGVIGLLHADANMYNVTSSLTAVLTMGSNTIDVSYGAYMGGTSGTVSVDDDCNATAAVTENSTTYYIEKFYQFSYKNGVYTLEKYSGTETNVTLPETYNGSVYVIGSYAFQDCTTLQTVIIPEGITTINEGAFYGCTSLVSITIPSTVTTIGGRAFMNCTSLVSIVIPEGITSIGDYLFYDCTALTSVTIPDSVTRIGDYAFHGCTALEEIIIPDGVTYLGYQALYGCTKLTTVEIPDGVTTLNAYTLYGCSSLESIVIGKNLTISTGVFNYCSALNTIYFKGTADEYNISIGEDNDYFKAATVYYYSESEPAESGNYWHYVEGVATAW